jgi:putative SOS response-associated peptidase YedK
MCRIVTERLEEDSLDRRLLIARWGLVPSWAKDIKIGSRITKHRQIAPKVTSNLEACPRHIRNRRFQPCSR